MYDYQQAGSQEKSIYIELWDVGGSTSHKNSRSIFYNNVNGVILVHDLSNKKSINNLRKWFRELLNSGKQDFTGTMKHMKFYAHSMNEKDCSNDDGHKRRISIAVVIN